MERLTAFEFIAATDAPQIVRLKGPEGVFLEVAMMGWVALVLAHELEQKTDLVIDGEGLGKPYWAGEPPPTWALAFNSYAEGQRIKSVRAAVVRELNRAKIALVQ